MMMSVVEPTWAAESRGERPIDAASATAMHVRFSFFI
jgi:hypothetical protein